jgi:hypothetical protein
MATLQALTATATGIPVLGTTRGDRWFNVTNPTQIGCCEHQHTTESSIGNCISARTRVVLTVQLFLIYTYGSFTTAYLSSSIGVP